jgi:hypothetical protein
MQLILHEARVPTGEIYSPKLKQQYPNRDWILTRILWLDGIEAHNKNTKARYIYIDQQICFLLHSEHQLVLHLYWLLDALKHS